MEQISPFQAAPKLKKISTIIAILLILIIAAVASWWVFFKNNPGGLSEIDRTAMASVDLWCLKVKSEATTPVPKNLESGGPVAPTSYEGPITFTPYEGKASDLSTEGYDISLNPENPNQKERDAILAKYGFKNEKDFETTAIKYRGNEEFLPKMIFSEKYIQCTNEAIKKK